MKPSFPLDQVQEHWELRGNFAVEPLERQGKSSRTWLVRAGGERLVAKLVRDRRRYVEPGLRVAAAVDSEGLRTGAPRPTRTGQACVTVEANEEEWTLALLRYVPGEPLPRAAASAALAGEALGRAHAVLLRESRRNWVPANLIDWFESRGAPPVAAVRDLDRLGLLTWAVVYGDPSPEVLVGESGGLGLIDWGTPSWGPLLHDVACWTTFFRVGRSRGAFLAAYRRWVPLRDEELVALPVFRALTRTLHG